YSISGSATVSKRPFDAGPFDITPCHAYIRLSPQHPGNDMPSRSVSIVLDTEVSYAESRRT
ncbi:hypothetical protein ACQ4T2_25525, partial [Escherichia coli]|uniref:hypothetical protein n=1 Tax=Escherichia coli TaxID=562 RepID=UPI003D31919B